VVLAEYFDGADSAPNAVRSDDYVGQIVLRPNNSMTWRGMRFFLITLMSISFAMAIAFAFFGYWMILIFSAIEMSVLFGCLYYLVRRSQTQEVVWFAPQRVVLEVGRRTPEVRHEWQRFFTKVLIQPPKHPWYTSRVVLRCRDEEREIGGFLTGSDKKELIRHLRQMIAAADRLCPGA
jgi:uncharacterized membrane protein